jgi:hypothetical protein
MTVMLRKLIIKGEIVMSRRSLDGLFTRKFQVGIGEAISSNRVDGGFGFVKKSKRITTN